MKIKEISLIADAISLHWISTPENIVYCRPENFELRPIRNVITEEEEQENFLSQSSDHLLVALFPSRPTPYAPAMQRV